MSDTQNIKKMSIELMKYLQFKKSYENGDFEPRRFGQAFYDYFKLGRIKEQSYFKNIYESDGDEAIRLINELFQFT